MFVNSTVAPARVLRAVASDFAQKTQITVLELIIFG
jgi:hypothetical protein